MKRYRKNALHRITWRRISTSRRVSRESVSSAAAAKKAIPDEKPIVILLVFVI